MIIYAFLSFIKHKCGLTTGAFSPIWPVIQLNSRAQGYRVLSLFHEARQPCSYYYYYYLLCITTTAADAAAAAATTTTTTTTLPAAASTVCHVARHNKSLTYTEASVLLDKARGYA